MLNKTVLMGRLTATPELKQTQGGTSVCSFALAVARSYARAGEQPETDFIDIVAWGKTAEFVCKYFNKGQLIALSGRIQTRMWTDRNDNKRKAVEVVAEEVFFAEPKRDKGSGSGQSARRDIAAELDDITDPMSGFTETDFEDGELPF